MTIRSVHILLSDKNSGGTVQLTSRDLINNCSSSVLRHVVNDNLGTEASIHQSVCSAESGTCTGDNDDLVIESDWLRLLVCLDLLRLFQETL